MLGLEPSEADSIDPVETHAKELGGKKRKKERKKKADAAEAEEASASTPGTLP